MVQGRHTLQLRSISDPVHPLGRKETPFPHLQFMAYGVPPPQIVTMLGKKQKTTETVLSLMYSDYTSNFQFYCAACNADAVL